MKRLSEEHRAHVALLERQFLQKKHQLLRAREAALWELEERHLHDRHQLAKRQLKDIFFLQRHQVKFCPQNIMIFNDNLFPVQNLYGILL